MKNNAGRPSELPTTTRNPSYFKNKENDPCILYVLGFVIVSLSSGLVYGWPALRRNLIKEGTELDEKKLGLIFTIGSWSTQGGRFFFGIARDRILGTRKTAVLSLIAATIGILGFAFTDKDNVILLSISMFLVGLGSGSQLCVQPVAGLFHRKIQGAIIASLSGAIQIASLIFLVLTTISSDRRLSFGGFSGCMMLLIVPTFLFLPKWYFVNKNDVIIDTTDTDVEEVERSTIEPPEVQQDDGYDTTEIDQIKIDTIIDETGMTDLKDTKSNVELIVVDVLPDNEEEDEDDKCDDDQTTLHILHVKKEDGAFYYIITQEYIFLLLWFSLLLIPQQYYIATIGLQLERQGDTTGTYTNIFSIIYASVAVVSPIFGKITDIFGLGLAQALASILTAISLFILSFDNSITLNYQIIGMICYGCGRLWTFGNFFSNVGKRFGYTHYGTLAGLALILSAIFSLTQYPLIALAVDGKEFYVNIYSGAVILTISLPYCTWLGIREKRGKSPLN